MLVVHLDRFAVESNHCEDGASGKEGETDKDVTQRSEKKKWW
jgi:hypothetical protein